MPVAQHPLSSLPQYYAECHGVIYVIDSTDEERLSESKRAFGACSLGRPGRGWGVVRCSVSGPTWLEVGPTPGRWGRGQE